MTFVEAQPSLDQDPEGMSPVRTPEPLPSSLSATDKTLHSEKDPELPKATQQMSGRAETGALRHLQVSWAVSKGSTPRGIPGSPSSHVTGESAGSAHRLLPWIERTQGNRVTGLVLLTSCDLLGQSVPGPSELWTLHDVPGWNFRPPRARGEERRSRAGMK